LQFSNVASVSQATNAKLEVCMQIVSLKINVENRFLNPPIRDINGRQPSNAEMFPFDLEIRIINNSKLTVEMKVSYFWTIIVYLFFSLLVILYFWISGELLSASKFILPFFLSILTQTVRQYANQIFEFI
jgi:hypothetical protein